MRGLALFALLGSLALAGCAAEVEGDPVIVDSSGVLVVDWSIGGSQDPSACRQSDADVINVAVETADGESLGEFEDACEVFRTGIELPPGDYFGDAVLLDPDGAQRTTAVDLGFFQIYGDDELVVPIDFPSDSFY
jgi:hypothetical protein